MDAESLDIDQQSDQSLRQSLFRKSYMSCIHIQFSIATGGVAQRTTTTCNIADEISCLNGAREVTTEDVQSRQRLAVALEDLLVPKREEAGQHFFVVRPAPVRRTGERAGSPRDS